MQTIRGDDPTAPRTATAVTYRERLWVPPLWWLLGIAAATLVTLEVTTTLVLGDIWAGWQVLIGVAVIGVVVGWLIWQSLTAIAVVGGELVVGPAHLPLAFVGELRLVGEAARRRLTGPQAHPDAYVFVRSWVRTAVLVEVADPDDPTPYWLVSTRHPEALAAALRPAATASAPSAPAPAAPAPSEPAPTEPAS